MNHQNHLSLPFIVLRLSLSTIFSRGDQNSKSKNIRTSFCLECLYCCFSFQTTLPPLTPKNTQPKIDTPNMQKRTPPKQISLCSHFYKVCQTWTKVPRPTIKTFKKNYLLDSLGITQEKGATRCEFSLLSIRPCSQNKCILGNFFLWI